MFQRGIALLAVLAATPAHATLIEYSFTGGFRNATVLVLEDFGVDPNHAAFTGGFVFDDAAPRTSYEESLVTYFDGTGYTTYLASSSTYDMSNLQLWLNLGDYTLRATGISLTINDGPQSSTPNSTRDTWTLAMRGDGEEVNGYTLGGVGITGWWYGGRAVTSSELQVPDNWGSAYEQGLVSGLSFGLASGTTSGSFRGGFSPMSVPEPGTLSLLGVGALGALATRRRKHVAARH
jgi:hypothetical protein